MSYADDNLPDALDRLGLLLDHAQAMALAGSGEDFPTMNDGAIRSFNHALFHVLMDAEKAYRELVDAHTDGVLKEARGLSTTEGGLQ